MNTTEHCAWENFEEFQYSVPPDTTNFTLPTLYLDEISSDYQDPDRWLCTHCTQNTDGREIVPGTAHCHTVWMSQQCNCVLISSVPFKHSNKGDAMPRLAWGTSAPLFQNSLRKAPQSRNMQQFDTCYELYFITW